MSRVSLTREDGLALLTLTAPPLNLFTHETMEELGAAVEELTAQPPRALLFAAEGRAVSGGVDVKTFAPLDSSTGAELWERWLGTAQALEDLPCPTVFAAHALCLTAAFELALACDLLLAAESAKFGLVEIVVGLTPSMGGPQRLAERRPGAGQELIYTGELFDAATLKEWGVVNRVWPDEGFAEAAQQFAARLAAGLTRAHAATKTIVRTQVEQGTRAADGVVPEVSGALFDTEDLKGAVQSFLTEGPGKATYRGR